MSGMEEEIPHRHDPVDLWNRASLKVKSSLSGPQHSAINKEHIAERLSGERSMVWTSLSQMAPANQATFVKTVVQNWPYTLERRALMWPLHFGVVANSITASAIATRVNADMFLLKADTPFLDAVRQCPKWPLALTVYGSGMLLYGCTVSFIQNILYREKRPCSSCVLTRAVLIALGTGIVMPMLTSPYLSYYVLLQREQKFPRVKNYIELAVLCREGTRAITPVLSRLVVFQTVVTAVGAFCMIWGRNRIFDSMDAAPELVREIMLSRSEKPLLKERLDRLLSKIPIFGRLSEKPEDGS